MPKLTIEAELIEVGTNWSGETSVVVQRNVVAADDSRGAKQTIDFYCDKDTAKLFAKHLYQPVTITVEAKGIKDPVSITIINDDFDPWRDISTPPTVDEEEDFTKKQVLAYTDSGRFVMATYYYARGTGGFWQSKDAVTDKLLKWIDLPENEKESDREEALKMLRIVRRGTPVWEWNGNPESPTVNPSILVFADYPEKRCHLFVKGGTIEYLSDCHHELRGQTIEMVPVEGWAADS